MQWFRGNFSLAEKNGAKRKQVGYKLINTNLNSRSQLPAGIGRLSVLWMHESCCFLCSEGHDKATAQEPTGDLSQPQGQGGSPPASLHCFFPPRWRPGPQGLSVLPWAVASPCCVVSSALCLHWAQLLKGFCSAKRLLILMVLLMWICNHQLQNPRENLF